jgi:hypothetical protein
LQRGFYWGAKLRIASFTSDKVALVWPITVLAFPVAMYGLSRSYIGDVVLSLARIGVDINKYRPELFRNFDDSIQVAIWILVFINAIFSFIRYQQRKTTTYFSSSPVFHISRLILFDLPLSYAVINTLLNWVDISIAVDGLLLDPSIKYPLIHQDLMYGLRETHDLILGYCFVLVILSLLPLVILYRERHERHGWIYRPLTYTGLLLAVLWGVLLVIHFGVRLEAINMGAIKQLDWNGIGTLTTDNIAPLQAYDVLKGLPRAFQFPIWIGYIFGARGLLIIYELYLLFNTQTEKQTCRSLIVNILERLK